MTIDEKYNILHINDKRYYVVKLTGHMVMEDMIPYSLKCEKFEIFDNTWVHLTEKLLCELDKINPIDEQTLLNLSYPWGKQPVFTVEKRTNFVAFKNIYLNTNQNASRARMNISFLIETYGMKPEDFSLIVRMHPSAEPDEAKEFYKEKTINLITKCMTYHNYSEDKIKSVIKNINHLNKILGEVSHGYNDFFLFDDYNTFLSYKSKVISKANEKDYNLKQKNSIKNTLDILGDAYKNKKFYESIEI